MDLCINFFITTENAHFIISTYTAIMLWIMINNFYSLLCISRLSLQIFVVLLVESFKSSVILIQRTAKLESRKNMQEYFYFPLKLHKITLPQVILSPIITFAVFYFTLLSFWSVCDRCLWEVQYAIFSYLEKKCQECNITLIRVYWLPLQKSVF